jgi:uncharacterized membrane protein
MSSATEDKQKLLRMEGILTALLRYGALFASAWIACGVALGSLPDTIAFVYIPSAVAHGCLVIGIVLLIALPVLRVAIMMMIFLLERDYRFALISAAVLCIITLGFLLGTMNSHIEFL